MILDPMIATGGTAIAAIDMLLDWGIKSIKLVSIVGSAEGIKAIQTAHPNVDIYVGAIDPLLNDRGYIVPGLGDAGDRLFKTGC